jgi:hypothetical protein
MALATFVSVKKVILAITILFGKSDDPPKLLKNCRRA